MNKLAIRLRRAAIGAVCSVIAVMGLVLLAPDSDSVTSNSQVSVRLAPGGAGSPGSRTIDRSTDDRAENARTNEVSPADRTNRTQRNAVPEPRVGSVDEIVWLSQSHSSTFDRFEAISALGESREPMAELTLLDLLYDQDPAIRESAVESLAYLGTHGSIQGLRYALKDANPLVRRTAIELLTEIGTGDALAALAAVLNDPDVDLRLAAVYELTDTESTAASALLQRFISDTDPSVRKLAAEFLNN